MSGRATTQIAVADRGGQICLGLIAMCSEVPGGAIEPFASIASAGCLSARDGAGEIRLWLQRCHAMVNEAPGRRFQSTNSAHNCSHERRQAADILHFWLRAEEKLYASMARRCNVHVPGPGKRLYAISNHHDGDVWLATVGKTLTDRRPVWASFTSCFSDNSFMALNECPQVPWDIDWT